MAGRPEAVDHCPRCHGGMYTMDSTTRFKQQCVRCGYSPQDRPERAEPVKVAASQRADRTQGRK